MTDFIKVRGAKEHPTIFFDLFARPSADGQLHIHKISGAGNLKYE